MTEASAASRAYLAARDHLITHREDYHEAAAAGFRWPDVGTANQLGDRLVRSCRARQPANALRIVGDDGPDESFSFDEMALRSDHCRSVARRVRCSTR